MHRSRLQERNPIDRARRRFAAGLCAGLVATLAGCGGAGLPIADGDAWDVAPTDALTLSPGSSFNLAATLPPGVAAGGVFDVDPSGAPLPKGITLTPSGLLTVGSAASGNAAGVVFRYTPPA